MRAKAAALLVAAALAACATPEPAPAPGGLGPMVLQPLSFDRLAGWSEDDSARVLPALLKSCNRIAKLPLDKSVGFEGMGGTAADWYAPCAAASRVAEGDHKAARILFETWFIPWQVTNDGRADGLFTGYFEPEIKGSRLRKGPYTHPIYGKPSDLVITSPGGRPRPDSPVIIGRMENGKVVPYYTRAEIEKGAINGTAPVLAWTDDAVDLAIMQIQGSGRVRLDDGSVIRLGVAGSNGHEFVGIGKVMKDEGKLGSDTSMPAIRAWLKANPEEGRTLLRRNPRYIFYGVNAGTDGPMGTEGVALTPERSLAVDPRFVPLGAPVWLDSVDPAGKPLRRLMVAQDTGAAIKGPVRGDVFWGAGEAAFQIAGKMKSPGRLVVFLPRARSPRLAER
jgi:membrane-bound lytic murein transglycosylase A